MIATIESSRIWSNGAAQSAGVELAAQALTEDGVVIIQGVVDRRHVQMLRERMLEDLDGLSGDPDPPVQFAHGHLQQDPPPFDPYLFDDILQPPAVIAVTTAVLGGEARNALYSGNTNLPGSLPQPIHVDWGQLWAGLGVAHRACSLVVNVPLVDMHRDNGSTELWPGSHQDTLMSIRSDSTQVPTWAVAARRLRRPPLQPEVSAGSILLRDMRLWRRGMPNRTTRPRPMLAMIHHASWIRCAPMRLPPESIPAFRRSGAFAHDVLADDGARASYLVRNHAYLPKPAEGQREVATR
ncbi:MAG TPA: phytanoyl-CoA dioxygenase family protein [Planctomycetota bacterium]|nr:phytanoyl-CoA dioxygenase family protein [Planctomycetota bacterium]